MACRAMVVNGDNGILVFFNQCTHEVVGALLHFRIGTLHSIQLNAIAIATRVDRRHRSATESDAIVVATDNHHLISFLRFLLQAVALLAIAHAACQHNHLIISVLLLTLLMFEGKHRARDERLTELITEVAGTVRGLDENLLGRLIEPLANGQQVFPVAQLAVFGVEARIARHIDCRAGDGPGARTTTHAVANLTTRARSSTVEGFHRRREVVRLCLQRDDTLNLLYLEPVGCRLVRRCKLLHHRSLGKRHIVFVCRENLIGILLRGLLNHLEERRLLFLTVDDEGATENLMAAVLGVDLGKAENLRVGERAPVLLLDVVQIADFLGRERQSFLLVVGFQVVDIADGFGLYVDREHVLVEPVVHALQHRVVVGIGRCHGEELFNTRNAAEAHVLCNLNGIRAPRRNHFPTWAHKESFQLLCIEQRGFAIKPTKSTGFFLTGGVINCRGNHGLLGSLEKKYHTRSYE